MVIFISLLRGLGGNRGLRERAFTTVHVPAALNPLFFKVLLGAQPFKGKKSSYSHTIKRNFQ